VKEFSLAKLPRGEQLRRASITPRGAVFIARIRVAECGNEMNDYA
jgi:hypothetical protein